MQRAAASTPSVPQSQARTSDSSPSKRQKVSAAPSWPATLSSDPQLKQVAFAEGEEERETPTEKLAEEAGETNWVLSTVNVNAANDTGRIRVARAGYCDIDQEAWRPALVGRRSFGEFNRELEVSLVTVFNSLPLMTILRIIY